MAAKERVNYGCTCPGCGQEENVPCAENDHPYMQTVDIKVLRVDGEFDVVEHGDADLRITCKRCGTNRCRTRDLQ